MTVQVMYSLVEIVGGLHVAEVHGAWCECGYRRRGGCECACACVGDGDSQRVGGRARAHDGGRWGCSQTWGGVVLGEGQPGTACAPAVLYGPHCPHISR